MGDIEAAPLAAGAGAEFGVGCGGNLPADGISDGLGIMARMARSIPGIALGVSEQ
jgi:hypothetical protein